MLSIFVAHLLSTVIWVVLGKNMNLCATLIQTHCSSSMLKLMLNTNRLTVAINLLHPYTIGGKFQFSVGALLSRLSEVFIAQNVQHKYSCIQH